MAKNDIDILKHIVAYTEQIEDTHTMFNKDYNTFIRNNTYKNSIALCVLQIGEISNHLSDEFKRKTPEIPWKEIRGLRNIVAHEYGNIDAETLWETITIDIPALHEFCINYING